MRSGVGAVVFLGVVVTGASAGEVILVNGGRLEGDLANEMLVVSTGRDLIEVAPEEVGVLTREEVRLKDGRIVRGSLVGGRLKVMTTFGEVAVKPDEVREFRAGDPRPVTTASVAPSDHATAAVKGAPIENRASSAGRVPGPGLALEIVAGETTLRRDAVSAGVAVGKVLRGELVTYVDSIDRRLRILNVLLFDGGHWIRVRAANGTEGWLPAEAVREVR